MFRKSTTSLSSVDSGLDVSSKHHYKSTMSIDYNKQLQEAGTLTAKTKKLKEYLMHSKETSNGSLKKKYISSKSESELDSDDMFPPSQFSPLANSTQKPNKLLILGNEIIDSRNNKSNDKEIESSDSNIVEEKLNMIDNIHQKKKVELLRHGLSLKDLNYNVKHEGEENSDFSVYSGNYKTNSKNSKKIGTNSEDNFQSSRVAEVTFHQKRSKEKEIFLKRNESSENSGDESRSMVGDSERKMAKKRTPKTSSQIISRNNVSSSESEDESVSSSNNEETTKQTSKLIPYGDSEILKFLHENPYYKKIEDGRQEELTITDSEDEVYLLQIPKSVNPHILQGFEFSLDKKTKLRTSSGKYFIRPQKDVPSSLLIYSNVLKRIIPKGLLKLEKYIKTKDQEEVLIEENRPQLLPDNIKIRHPLFGYDYESKINLEEEIKEKLQQALKRFELKKKSSKKKKRDKKGEDKCLLISQILEEKMSRVSKDSIINNVSNIWENYSGVKVEVDPECSTRVKEESIKKKHMVKVELDAEHHTENNTSSEQQSNVTLKKKRKRHFVSNNLGFESFQNESIDVSLEDKKKKKKRKKLSNDQ